MKEEQAPDQSTPSAADSAEPAAAANQFDFNADAEQIEELLRAGDQAKLEIGAYLARRYYRDSRQDFEQRRTKDYSLRKLLAALTGRGKVKLSKSALHNYVAVHLQETDLGLEPEQAAHLGFAARVVLLREKSAKNKRALARRAIAERLDVRSLRALVRGEAEPRTTTATARLKAAAKRILLLAEAVAAGDEGRDEDFEAAVGMLGSALALLTEGALKSA
jgi:hypothetical protein